MCCFVARRKVGLALERGRRGCGNGVEAAEERNGAGGGGGE